MDSKLIYDVGMHIGQDSEFYLKKGFDVIAIEANPKLVEEQKVRFSKYIENGRLKIINVGIGQKKGKCTFYVNDYLSEWSSFDKTIGTREGKFHEIEVTMVPLEDVLREHGIPYYLKIDIEGYDFIALQSIQFIPDKPRYISVENGQKPFLDFLYSEGYTHFKFINQQKVPNQIVKYPPLEGVFSQHIFPHGASGLFGEETPGEWLDYDNVLALISSYWGNPNRDANIHGWFDLHAKRECNNSFYLFNRSSDNKDSFSSIPRSIRISSFSDDKEWKNGIYLKDTHIFFIIIAKEDKSPIEKGNILRFNNANNSVVIKVFRVENACNSSIFITVDKHLDPEKDGSPNQVLFIDHQEKNLKTILKQFSFANLMKQLEILKKMKLNFFIKIQRILSKIFNR